MALSQEQTDLMAKYGYTLTKINPLTLVHEDGGIATRRAAESLVETIQLNNILNKRLHQLEARLNKELPTKVDNRTPFGSNAFVQSMLKDEEL